MIYVPVDFLQRNDAVAQETWRTILAEINQNLHDREKVRILEWQLECMRTELTKAKYKIFKLQDRLRQSEEQRHKVRA